MSNNISTMPNVDANIHNTLTSDEKEVFSVIKNVIEKYTPSTEAFVAGGWVRDKLLGIPSNDIDIVLSNLSGEDFAHMLARELGLKNPHVIRSNPEKSKHVETAKMYVPLSSGTEQELDFARARSEVYNNESRVPTEIKPATPQEDASRRDLTINAIFYDISNNKVVDFTGQGIKDLISGTIRTPGNPLDRFFEDPLRVIRTIRFAAKYNGKIDPETYKAMMDPDIREKIVKMNVPKALAKERIGDEIVKILKNPNSDYALQLLKDTGIWQDIITQALTGTKYEGHMETLEMEQNNPHHLLTLWQHTMQVAKNLMANMPDLPEEKRVIMLLSTIMHDIGKLFKDIHTDSKSYPGRTSYIGHEMESREISEHIMRYLHMESNMMKQVGLLARHHMRPHRFVEGPGGGGKAMRKFIREMGEKGLNWVDVFNIALADAQSKGMDIDPELTQKYRELESQLNEAMISMQATPDKSTITPILNGHEIMQVLNIKPGAWMSELTEFVKDLMDENPDITKEEASQKLLERYKDQDFSNYKKQASKNKEKHPTTCPNHLIEQKTKDINDMMNEKKYYEAFSTIKMFSNDYNDEESINLIASTMYKLVLTDHEKYWDNNLLQHIFDRAEKDFFNPVLCSSVVGMLLLGNTPTEDKIIEEIAHRMLKIAPGIFKNAIDMLPDEVHNKKLLSKFKRSCNENL